MAGPVTRLDGHMPFLLHNGAMVFCRAEGVAMGTFGGKPYSYVPWRMYHQDVTGGIRRLETGIGAVVECNPSVAEIDGKMVLGFTAQVLGRRGGLRSVYRECSGDTLRSLAPSRSLCGPAIVARNARHCVYHTGDRLVLDDVPYEIAGFDVRRLTFDFGDPDRLLASGIAAGGERTAVLRLDGTPRIVAEMPWYKSSVLGNRYAAAVRGSGVEDRTIELGSWSEGDSLASCLSLVARDYPPEWALSTDELAYLRGKGPKPLRGLGDVVAMAAKPIATLLGMSDCHPCGQRQQKLNELFPFGDKPS